MTIWWNIPAVDCSASNENNCYTFHDVDSTWNEARDACRDMGAHLVTMETTDEWNKVKGFLADKVTEPGSYTHYYIGLRRESGIWKWTEAGSSVATDDSRWQSGEPFADSREVCGEIWHPSSGTQGHFNNVMRDRYICLNTERSYKRQGHDPLKHFVGFLWSGGNQNNGGKTWKSCRSSVFFVKSTEPFT